MARLDYHCKKAQYRCVSNTRNTVEKYRLGIIIIRVYSHEEISVVNSSQSYIRYFFNFFSLRLVLCRIDHSFSEIEQPIV